MLISAADRAKTAWNGIFEKPDGYEYYDLKAPHEFMAKTARFFKKNNVTKILDLGCGLGNNLFFLHKMGFEAWGADVSDVAIKTIKKISDDNKLNIPVDLCEFQKLPYNDNFFDAIISVQTLNHGYEKDVLRGINEMRRVLKPSGYIFITLPGRISQGKIRYCLVQTAKKIWEHGYIPTKGEETGVPHVIYNKSLLKRHYRYFEFVSLEKDKRDYYCLMGRKDGSQAPTDTFSK